MPKSGPRAGFAAALKLFFLLQLTALSAQDDCAEIFQEFEYPSQLVNQVLNQFEVPSGKWAPINRDLTREMRGVRERAREKAADLTPNPYDSPRQEVVIGRLQREAEREIFREVMERHGVDDRREIHEMFDEIQYEKAMLIWDCFLEERQRG